MNGRSGDRGEADRTEEERAEAGRAAGDRTEGGRAESLPEDLQRALNALGGESGGHRGISAVTRLSGGASRLTWLVSLSGPVPDVVCQVERPGSLGHALSMRSQVALMELATRNGVSVPAVLGASTADQGPAWVILERVDGTALPKEVLHGPQYSLARSRLARQAGMEMARIHAMPAAGLAPPASDPVESLTILTDVLGRGHPAFELGLKWLDENRPPPGEDVVVHGDFRLGNLLVDSAGITGVLDWELAHRGCGAEDLGWFCVRSWRFGSPLTAGGVGSVETLRSGYAEVHGSAPTADEIRWWEAYGTLRWGLICLLQANTHLSGKHRSPELAAIGRRAIECEEDLLEITQGSSMYQPSAPSIKAPPSATVPSAPDLLEAVSEHLEELRSTMSGAQRYQMRVSANILRTVRREILAAPDYPEAHRCRLESLGVADDIELATRIREESLDAEHEELGRLVRESVRDALAVSNPGHLEPDS